MRSPTSLVPEHDDIPETTQEVDNRQHDQAQPCAGGPAAEAFVMLDCHRADAIAVPARADDSLRFAERTAADEGDAQDVRPEKLDAAGVICAHPKQKAREDVERVAHNFSPERVVLYPPKSDNDMVLLAHFEQSQALGGLPLAVAGVEKDIAPAPRDKGFRRSP